MHRTGAGAWWMRHWGRPVGTTVQSCTGGRWAGQSHVASARGRSVQVTSGCGHEGGYHTCLLLRPGDVRVHRHVLGVVRAGAATTAIGFAWASTVEPEHVYIGQAASLRERVMA